jgi:hypothetical protein
MYIYIQEYFLTSVSPEPSFYFDVNYATNRFMLIIRDKVIFFFYFT